MSRTIFAKSAIFFLPDITRRSVNKGVCLDGSSGTWPRDAKAITRWNEVSRFTHDYEIQVEVYWTHYENW